MEIWMYVCIALGVGVLACVVSLLLTKVLIGVALDRKNPPEFENVRSLLAGSASMKQIFKKQKEAADALVARPSEEVHITSVDGLDLVGFLHRVPDARRLVIAFHGWRSSGQMDFGIIAPFLERNGCDVLYVQQRGQNESEGAHIGFGLLERFDCVAWANYCASRFPGVPIYLSGVSMGATTVLMASGEVLPEAVVGITADCAFVSPEEIGKHILTKNLHLPYGKVRSFVVNSFFRQKLARPADDTSTVEALGKNTRPVLFVHGASDRFVPVTHTYQNYLACRAKKELLIVPGADHGMSYLVEQQKYENTLLAFFAECESGAAQIPAQAH